KSLTDINDNVSSAAFDALGRVTALALSGKSNEGDSLSLPTVTFSYTFGSATTPSVVYQSARERHQQGGSDDGTSSGFQPSFTYFEAPGRELQKKVQAEDGPAPLRGTNGQLLYNTDGTLRIGPSTNRWIGTGRTVFNNKGNPVKQYEPFFSSASSYESETDLT